MKDKENELIALLGAEKLKNIGEQFAEIVQQHNLHRSPDVCRKLLDYFSDVITVWNCATDTLEIDVEEYSKIVLFRDESIFSAFLEKNAHLIPIYGHRDYEKQLFPNIFVVAIKTKE